MLQTWIAVAAAMLVLSACQDNRAYRTAQIETVCGRGQQAADGKTIRKQDGTPVADTDDPAVATDVADRLNDDEARREEDKWSA